MTRTKYLNRLRLCRATIATLRVWRPISATPLSANQLARINEQNEEFIRYIRYVIMRKLKEQFYAK